MQPPGTLYEPDDNPPLSEAAISQAQRVPISPRELAVVLRADQMRRWRRGERVSVEEYLRRHGELKSQAESVVDLIATEILLREECGEGPLLEEYVARFPDLEPFLRRHFELARTLSAQELPSFVPATVAEAGVRHSEGPPTLGTATLPGESIPATAAPLAHGAHSAAPHASAYVNIPGYQILAPLGRGGMGMVFMARQVALNRIVALKMILPAHKAGRAERERFRNEADAVARLQHPNIVQIFEIGDHRGQAFLALEYCPGGSLLQKLEGKPWQPTDAAVLVRTIAVAVHAAHLARVVHRDLTPANVLLDAEGRPKITDFGLAKKLDEDGTTKHGDILGTPSYMSPEQAAGHINEVGPASDVYSLGAILYELLTGRPPFRGASVMETLDQVRSQEPVAPARLQPRLPRDLETICLRCLEKSRHRRYPSAQELADDLGRFLAHEPIRARPTGQLGRLKKWVQRRPAVAALLAALIVLTATALVGITWAYRQALASLAEAREAQRRRVLARIEQLQTATPQAVPDILAELRAEEEAILPRLRELWAQEEDVGRRMRAGLALLNDEPALVKDGLAAWILQTEEPRELLLAREALMPFAAELAPQLWRHFEQADSSPATRFRALLALAAFDPKNLRWHEAAPFATEELLGADKLYSATLAEALDPVGEALREPLADVFRGARLPQHRHAAAEFLTGLADERPDFLANLIADAEPDQFAILRPILVNNLDKAIPVLEAALAPAAHAWNDAAPNASWKVPADWVVDEIRQSGGMLHEHFAMCAALPIDRAKPVAEELRRAGYRPLRVRPYRSGGEQRAALVWTRDRRDFRILLELAAQDVAKQDQAFRSLGFEATDIAGYCDATGTVRYAGLWSAADTDQTTRLLVGVSQEKLDNLQIELLEANLLPATLHALALPGRTLYSQLWHSGKGESRLAVRRDRLGIAGAYLDWLAVDVSVSENFGWREEPWAWAASSIGGLSSGWLALAIANLSRLEVGAPVHYAAAWQETPGWQSERLVGLTPDVHLAQARKLAAEGFRPAAMSVAAAGASTVVASIWHRPAVSQEAQDHNARRQANAAAALMALGSPEKAWTLLRHSARPDARTYLIQRLAAFRVNPRLLVNRLGEETETSARRALILALGDYGPDQLSADVRAAIIPTLLKWYQSDPDPGIHGAIDWLLGQNREGPLPRPLDWGQATAIRRAERSQRGRAPLGARWFVNGQGQGFTVIPGPVEFTMGLSADQPRESDWDVQHIRRIDRTFAIGTRPVTAEQFRQFLRERSKLRVVLSPTEGPATPVDYYDAVSYCRWLSEKEGIAIDQMCYPDLEEIEKCRGGVRPLKLQPGYLRKTGYRLPTDAEWEYSCRAGAAGLRFFGDQTDMLERYGWYQRNSGDRSLPVGQKRPNDLGLFDVHGPVWQWCQPSLGFTAAGGLEDVEDRRAITENAYMIVRGGAFTNPPRGLRAGLRHFFPPKTMLPTVGFRLARTMP
jgi:formylglycine-generating enzyme required for sulfatase activity